MIRKSLLFHLSLFLTFLCYCNLFIIFVCQNTHNIYGFPTIISIGFFFFSFFGRYYSLVESVIVLFVSDFIMCLFFKLVFYILKRRVYRG